MFEFKIENVKCFTHLNRLTYYVARQSFEIINASV